MRRTETIVERESKTSTTESDHDTGTLAPACVGIVGAGFSGSMLAARLLGLLPNGSSVVLIERSGRFAAGLAYGSARESNLLNVPAGNMSAAHEDAGHFVEWAQARNASVLPGDFLPRRTYAEYLRDALDAAEEAGRVRGITLTRRTGMVVDIQRGADGNGTHPITIALSDGTALACDAAALCMGNFSPSMRWLPPSDRAELTKAGVLGRIVADPWRNNALHGLGSGELDSHSDVLLVGTGLTMVDIACELRAKGHAGTIHAVSRHGLTPRRHRSPSQPPKSHSPLVDLTHWDGTLRSLVRLVRSGIERGESTGVNWRDVIASLRGSTPALWARLSDTDKHRFLRHVRPYWEVARHRLPPVVAESVDKWLHDGSLRIFAGRIAGVEASADGLMDVVCRVRGDDDTAPLQRLRVARIINCTGPECDVTQIDDELMRRLLTRGVLNADTFRLGIDADDAGRVRGAAGQVDHALYAVGPLRRGQLWETTAVPELRQQVSSVAASIVDNLASRRAATSSPRHSDMHGNTDVSVVRPVRGPRASA